MHYFLIRQDNTLQHLPEFSVIAPGEARPTTDGGNGAAGIFTEKRPVRFVCPCQGTDLPLSFLVMDEEATVRVCIGRRLQAGDGGVVITGLVSDEYEAPFLDHALETIQVVVAAIPK